MPEVAAGSDDRKQHLGGDGPIDQFCRLGAIGHDRGRDGGSCWCVHLRYLCALGAVAQSEEDSGSNSAVRNA